MNFCTALIAGHVCLYILYHTNFNTLHCLLNKINLYARKTKAFQYKYQIANIIILCQ